MLSKKIKDLKPEYGSYCINIEDVITDLSRHLSKTDLAVLESIDAV